jgi:hypothetical protein
MIRILIAAVLLALGVACASVPPGSSDHVLEGEWVVSLTMDTMSGGRPLPPKRTIAGRFVFSGGLPDDEPWISSAEFIPGRSGLDLSPYFGGPYARDVSTTVAGGMQEDFFRELAGWAGPGDSVSIALIPRMSHGGIAFEGSVSGDTIRGRWVQEAYCCGARGSFVMSRVPRSTASDSLLAQAVRAHERARREHAAAVRARERRIGYVRLRVMDDASGRYVPIGFAAAREATEDSEGVVSFTHRSGESGWGPAHDFEPGTYRFTIYDYPCAEMGEMPDSKYFARIPALNVVVASGDTAYHEMRINLDSLRRGDRRPARERCWADLEPLEPS